jgi:aldehyde:ferredoxin oxidoreductase
MAGGYMGKILRIDLSRRQVEEHPLSEETCRKFIGGSGLGAKILYDETGPNTDPLGPDNPLIFMAGPTANTQVPTSGRHAVVARSPLTGVFGESDVGGTWGAKLKQAGLDGIVIVGKAEAPTYLWIQEGRVEFRDASHLWGKDSYEIDPILKAETHENATVAAIGPAGERLVLLAGIVHDGRDARMAGRCGLGAVMGSKNLKAVVVQGSAKTPVARPEELAASVKELMPTILESSKTFGQLGTAGGVITHETMGNFPLQNWKLGRWEEGAKKISGAAMAESILVKRYACRQCPIACGREVKVEKGPYAGVDGAGPEYETMGTLGGMCLVDNLEAIAMANELCNRYGMDTISVGSVIAFAMECYENGLLTKGDTDGIELTWGNHQALVEMVKKIARREGIGDLLAKGVRRAAQELGGVAPEFAMHVKGLELPAHDPRAYFGAALAFATSARGACHLSAWTMGFERGLTMPEVGADGRISRWEVDGKAEFVAKCQFMMGMYDSMKYCKFISFGGMKVSHCLNWFNQVTGWDMDLNEFFRTGERLLNLKRMINVRWGVSRKDDTLPPRSLTLKRTGPGLTEAELHLPPLGRLLSDYYEYCGWNEWGIPKPEKLQELGLS